ncbi:hypothetical protein HKBW3S42_00289 [Candidatus Hakubella thermalkaliphila]|uniref:DUF2442 domain-containing protein n=3 Tax=Candidatus Hakubella thermalkaliphila TaxID=2754717 RepID=A0A6V8P992_9ACTN|nr:DUF2442 domain-containing protein [Candidatus Hakubella thermalkaliphila]GFP19463.1 hypothetical protein HKBW3S03_00968 [Candidatus Hakubella thermalkaliphila]GFP22557.1 hypothetical protein HKBW3S09_00024 [Candidatus Hakubella thermalkaliphila]GFP27386.1 hypothetical protein HKBW3S33_00799 [Candidatus Hakubella thermalkaliphila]GFP31983.1 hypothetical protein HKBW3S42_00289 [Candidatus Hakubella thermalkaliphila]GFP35097.1 hypothetical protein HKBW3S43_00889 [Candidatus Hakubella thermalka
MSSLVVETRLAKVQWVTIAEDTLTVDLSDGRTISVPLSWYPRLLHGTPEERNHWRLIGQGEGIHWPDLDEDISVDNLILGKPSGESQHSFKKWQESRTSRSAASSV